MELLCYVVMGFFPALVILSMVSPAHATGASPLPRGPGLTLQIVKYNPVVWEKGKRRPVCPWDPPEVAVE